MTPANPDALADALAQTLWEQSYGTLASASWEGAHRIAKFIPDGQAAWSIETARRKASEIVTLHVAPLLAAKEAAEARAAQLQAEVEALKEERAEEGGWKSTLRYCESQWSDERGAMLDKLQAERAENARLREALKPFADAAALFGPPAAGREYTVVDAQHLRAARAATAREGQADD